MWWCRLNGVDEDAYPKCATDFFRQCNANIFPSVNKLIKIFCTLPVTTATNERSFSTLRRLKTYLRNTTGEERLNGLALLNIHRDIPVSPEEVLEDFSKQARKMNLHL
nr:unnamed protein product [Callosobruchus chinensis]